MKIRSLTDIHQRSYMLYPSHFWPYKNHRMLITAYGVYLSRSPQKIMDLVFYGSFNDLADELKIAVKKMNLEKRIHFFSYPSPKKESYLLKNCKLLIFPSQYEDYFPCSIIKAFHIGKPVLCSDLDIIKDIAKDAAMYFDMRKPEEIAACIHTITSDPQYAVMLKQNGRSWFNDHKEVNGPHSIIMKSCASVLEDKKEKQTFFTGVCEDGWMSGACRLTFESDQKDRFLELRVEAPIWHPFDKIHIEICNEKGKVNSQNVYRGNELTVRHALPHQAGYLDFLMVPLFRPSESNLESNDMRYLSLIFKECCIVSNNKDWSLVKIEHNKHLLA